MIKIFLFPVVYVLALLN
ncbi:hypothetical protein F383_11786 [Gossypium arboreum]|uniref:Uncharacterized protein n=1 Tax=Gossypium arboreum TaxID=29729 RepID=A0A0B0NFQ3_GOSAR|nr:hypothetical protein F383_11786 [Gossypium arboreum]